MVRASLPGISISPEGVERVMEAMGTMAAAEKLVRRAELIAAEETGWHKVYRSPVVVSFCRGFGGAHTPHFVYMQGVEVLTREDAVRLTFEARLAATA